MAVPTLAHHAGNLIVMGVVVEATNPNHRQIGLQIFRLISKVFFLILDIHSCQANILI